MKTGVDVRVLELGSQEKKFLTLKSKKFVRGAKLFGVPVLINRVGGGPGLIINDMKLQPRRIVTIVARLSKRAIEFVGAAV